MEQAKVFVCSSSGIALVNRLPSAARPIESNLVLFVHFASITAFYVGVFPSLSSRLAAIFFLRATTIFMPHCVILQQKNAFIFK